MSSFGLVTTSLIIYYTNYGGNKMTESAPETLQCFLHIFQNEPINMVKLCPLCFFNTVQFPPMDSQSHSVIIEPSLVQMD